MHKVLVLLWKTCIILHALNVFKDCFPLTPSLPCHLKTANKNAKFEAFFLIFCTGTWKKEFSSKCIALKVDMLLDQKIHCFQYVHASFSLEILHAGAVKGIKCVEGLFYTKMYSKIVSYQTVFKDCLALKYVFQEPLWNVGHWPVSSVLWIIMCAPCFRCCTPTWTTTLSILTAHSTFHGHGSKPCTLKTDQCAVNISHMPTYTWRRWGLSVPDIWTILKLWFMVILSCGPVRLWDVWIQELTYYLWSFAPVSANYSPVLPLLCVCSVLWGVHKYCLGGNVSSVLWGVDGGDLQHLFHCCCFFLQRFYFDSWYFFAVSFDVVTVLKDLLHIFPPQQLLLSVLQFLAGGDFFF